MQGLTSSSSAASLAHARRVSSSSSSSWRPRDEKRSFFQKHICPRRRGSRAARVSSHSGSSGRNSSRNPTPPHPGGVRVVRIPLLHHLRLGVPTSSSTSRLSSLTARAGGDADSASAAAAAAPRLDRVQDDVDLVVDDSDFQVECDVDFEQDPGLNHALLAESDCLSVARRFTRDAEWVAYQSPRRYWDTIISLAGSVVARRVAMPSFVVACWAVTVSELARGTWLQAVAPGIAAGVAAGVDRVQLSVECVRAPPPAWLLRQRHICILSHDPSRRNFPPGFQKLPKKKKTVIIKKKCSQQSFCKNELGFRLVRVKPLPSGTRHLASMSPLIGVVGGAVSVLLAFRTNAAYARFGQAADSFAEVLAATRNLSRKVAVWCPPADRDSNAR